MDDYNSLQGGNHEESTHLIIITDSDFADYARGGCGNVLSYGDEDFCPFCGVRSDRILRRTEKGIDSQMLLEPFEKDFCLPTATKQLCDGSGQQGKGVSENNILIKDAKS